MDAVRIIYLIFTLLYIIFIIFDIRAYRTLDKIHTNLLTEYTKLLIDYNRLKYSTDIRKDTDEK